MRARFHPALNAISIGQFALSLRALFRNREWLETHVLKGRLTTPLLTPFTFEFGTNPDTPDWPPWCALSAESGQRLISDGWSCLSTLAP